MKLFNWRVMLSNTADQCKHTQFTCNQCGSMIFRHKRYTENDKREGRRLVRRIQKMIELEELNLENNK